MFDSIKVEHMCQVNKEIKRNLKENYREIQKICIYY